MEIADTKKRKNLISLTPLIDVVFILLIFFMLASSFVEWKFFELGISESESLSINAEKQSVVVVGFDKEYLLNDSSMNLEQIVSNVKAQIRLQSDHIVLIQPATDLPLQQLVVVLEAIGEVAGKNISLIKDEE